MRGGLYRLIAVLCGLLLGGLLVLAIIRLWPGPEEVSPEHYEALRARLDYNPHSLYMFDEELSYRLKPRFVGIRQGSEEFPHHTNSLGLLGTKEVPDGGTRILFLGDSVTYGDRVRFEEIFTSQLRERGGVHWYVGNGACPGWSTHQSLRFYREHLGDEDWDAVVLVFCLNDLVRFEWVYESDSEFRLSAEIENAGGLGPLAATGAGLRLLELRRGFAADPRTTPLADHNATTLFAWDERKWEEFRETVLRLDDIPNLVVVAMPSLLQLVASDRGAPGEIVWAPQRRLEEACGDVPVIDAAEAFEDGEDPRPLFLDNLHLSPAGHHRMAEFLRPRLRARLPD